MRKYAFKALIKIIENSWPMVTLIKECNVVNHKWPKNGPICFQYFCNYEVINHVAFDKNFTWLIVVRLSIAFCVLLSTKFSIWIEYCWNVEWIFYVFPMSSCCNKVAFSSPAGHCFLFLAVLSVGSFVVDWLSSFHLIVGSLYVTFKNICRD